MGLGKQMLERLRMLAAEEVPGSDRHAIVTADDGPIRATLECFDHDRYSVTLRSLEVGGTPCQGDARSFLSARAAEIARQLGYLEEPLAVWELDGGEKVAQLRSSPPQREGAEVSYWEITLTVGEQASVRMVRYRWAPGMAEREVVAYPATFALVGRMADSLAAALRAGED